MLQVQRLRLRIGIVRFVWLAALAAMLACPIDYRGGAELPHAHAIFQLIYDAAHGSIDHHHDGDPAADDDVGSALPAVQTPGLTAVAGARLSPMDESAEGLVIALVAMALWGLPPRERQPATAGPFLGDGERPAPEAPPPRQRRAAI